MNEVLFLIIGILIGVIIVQNVNFNKPKQSKSTIEGGKQKKKRGFFDEKPLEEMTNEEIKAERDFRTGYSNILNYNGTSEGQVD
jgi:hypothetical protein